MSTYAITRVFFGRPVIVECEGDNPLAAAARADDTAGSSGPGSDGLTPAAHAASAVLLVSKPSRGPITGRNF